MTCSSRVEQHRSVRSDDCRRDRGRVVGGPRYSSTRVEGLRRSPRRAVHSGVVRAWRLSQPPQQLKQCRKAVKERIGGLHAQEDHRVPLRDGIDPAPG